MQGIKITKTIEVDFISHFKDALERDEFKCYRAETLNFAQYFYNVFKHTRDKSYSSKHAALQCWLHQWAIKEQQMDKKQVEPLTWVLEGHVVMQSPNGAELKFELAEDSVTAWHFKPRGEERFRPITNENAKGVLLNYVFPPQPEAIYSFQLCVPFVQSGRKKVLWFAKCLDTNMLDLNGKYNIENKKLVLHSSRFPNAWDNEKEKIILVPKFCRDFMQIQDATEVLNAFVDEFRRVVEDENNLSLLTHGTRLYDIEFKLVQKPCQNSESSQTSISE